MSTKTEIENTNGFYFITFTCYKWMRMYEELEMYDSIYKHLNNFIKKGETICGYVIMPNHIHLLTYHKEENGKLKNLVGNLKRFMAYDIVELYEQSDKVNTLLEMKKGITERDRKKNQLHRVFEESYDVKRCYTIFIS